MKVAVSWVGERVRLDLVAEPGDKRTSARGVRLVRREVNFRPSPDFALDAAHPDLIGLVAVLACYPFAGRRISLSTTAVSAALAQAVAEHLGVDLGPVDAALAPRRTDESAVPALCFSGGADSVAALSLLPADTELVHLYRITPPEFQDWPGYCSRNDLFDGSVARKACARVAMSGRVVHSHQTDLEWLRHPVALPVDLSVAAPAVLLADDRGYDAVAFGTVLEAGYNIGRAGYRDYATRPEVTRWRRVFEAVGLPILVPVIGASEVVTTRIAMESPFADVVESCPRTRRGRPCMNCWKCFRKKLLDHAVAGVRPPEQELDRLFAAMRVRKYLTPLPIKHELVLTYLTQRLETDHELVRLLSDRVGAASRDVGWLERYYSPSLELVPERYRAGVEEALRTTTAPMDVPDEQRLRATDIAGLTADDTTRARADRLLAAMEAHAHRWSAQGA